MADICEITDKRTFVRKELKEGDVINGVALLANENFFEYEDSEYSVRIKKLNSELTAQDQIDLLNGAKLVHITKMGDEFDKFRELGYEYPTSSGNMFSLSDSAIKYLNGIVLRKDTTIQYPMNYTGIGDTLIVLNNASDIDALDLAALTAHETERLTRELPAIASIKAALTIDDVFSVVY